MVGRSGFHAIYIGVQSAEVGCRPVTCSYHKEMPVVCAAFHYTSDFYRDIRVGEKEVEKAPRGMQQQLLILYSSR